MNYTEASELSKKLDARLKEISVIFDSFPTGHMGLTPDYIKFSPAFKAANDEFERVFKAYREVNAYIYKYYKKEHYAASKKRT